MIFFNIGCLQLHEIEVENHGMVEDLKQKLSHFENQCNQHEAVLNSTVQKTKAQIDKLQEEKAMLEVRIVPLR